MKVSRLLETLKSWYEMPKISSDRSSRRQVRILRVKQAGAKAWSNYKDPAKGEKADAIVDRANHNMKDDARKAAKDRSKFYNNRNRQKWKSQ